MIIPLFFKGLNQEFTMAAIVRLSLPLIPKLLSFDIGGGLSENFRKRILSRTLAATLLVSIDP